MLRQVPKMIASFGSKVLVKKRRCAASGALIRLEFEERWSEGLYLGLSDQVADGHLVYVDGTFTHTRSVRNKAKLVDAKELQRDRRLCTRRDAIEGMGVWSVPSWGSTGS